MQEQYMTYRYYDYNEELTACDTAIPWEPKYWKKSPVLNLCLSTFITLIISLFFLITAPKTRHWMVIPVILCGIFSGSDIIRWFRGEIDVFDPLFLVAVFLFISVFLAPLMHLYYDFYGKGFYVSDWPHWLGLMAAINFLGILFFKLTQSFIYKKTRSTCTYWQVDPVRIFVVAFPILSLSFISLVILHMFFGGLVKNLGEIQMSAGAGALTPMLSVFRMFSDPFIPLTMMIAISWLHIKRPEKVSSLATMFILLSFTFLMQFVTVGTRGSRAALIGGVIVVVIIMHYTLRPISKKWILLGFAFTLVFVYLYDFRKKIGTEGWKAFYDTEARESMVHKMGGIGLHTTLLGDLARADLQAVMLHNLIEKREGLGYEYLKGQTYVMAFLNFIPRAVWKNKPNPQIEAGALVLYGYTARKSTRQYGLAGEAMMNFGPLGIIPAFAIFGCILGAIRKKTCTLLPSDGRLFIVPILLLVIMRVVIYDSIGLVFELLVRGILPFIVFYFGCVKARINPIQ